MKRLITILISAVAAVALLVGGTAYAGKPGTTHTTTPTPNVVMESGSGYLSANATTKYVYFPSTFNRDSGWVGYSGVRHVSLTYSLTVPGEPDGWGQVTIFAGFQCDPDLGGTIEPIQVGSLISDMQSISGSNEQDSDGITIEFNAYEGWYIELQDQSLSGKGGSFLTYSYTETYPAQ